MGNQYRIVLVAKPKSLDQCPVTFEIGALEVVQKPAATTNHLEETAATMMIFSVRAEVVGQVIYAFGQQSDLNTRRTCIGLVAVVLRYRRCFLECHVILFPSFQAISSKPRSLLDPMAPVKTYNGVGGGEAYLLARRPGPCSTAHQSASAKREEIIRGLSSA